MYINGRVKKVENVTEVQDITNDYIRYNPKVNFDILNDGLFF